jgi:hypothetical protein
MHLIIIILVFYWSCDAGGDDPTKIIKDDAPFPLAWFEV